MTTTSSTTISLPSPTTRIQLLVLVCAVSAGVHAVLAPAHLEEGPLFGVGFAAAALALAVVAVVLDRRPYSPTAVRAAALVLSGLVVGYLATRIATLPVPGAHQEPFDAVGVGTKLIEVIGLALAIKSINEGAADGSVLSAAEKGVQS